MPNCLSIRYEDRREEGERGGGRACLEDFEVSSLESAEDG